MLGDFGSFKKAARLDIKSPTLSDKYLPEFGEITKLYTKTSLKYVCDVRLYSGIYIDNIPLPGPFYDAKTGYYSGIKIPFFLGQRIAVGFMNNNKDTPYIQQVYPFDGGKKTKGQLDKEDDYKADEMSIGHISGHKTEWKEDKIVFLDKDLVIRQSIDYSGKKYLLDFGTSKVEVENDTKIKLTLTNSVTVLMESDKITLTATDIKIDGKLEVTGDTALKAKLEVTGTSKLKDDVTVTGKVDASAEVTAFNTGAKSTLSKHMHPTAIPGPASTPTPGT